MGSFETERISIVEVMIRAEISSCFPTFSMQSHYNTAFVVVGLCYYSIMLFLAGDATFPSTFSFSIHILLLFTCLVSFSKSKLNFIFLPRQICVSIEFCDGYQQWRDF